MIYLSVVFSFFLMLIGLSSCGPSHDEVKLAKVDLSRMAGGWYIVATIPNFLERGVIGGYDVFTPESSGDIREDFYMHLHSFENERKHFTVRITVQPDTGNADWRVHLMPFVSLPFQVIYTDPNYEFVLFGEQDREWGWIYSRTQTISDADYQAMLGQFGKLGYDTARFLKFIQTPEQIGQPGYWNDGVQGLQK